jgi:hypothetical protein
LKLLKPKNELRRKRYFFKKQKYKDGRIRSSRFVNLLKMSQELLLIFFVVGLPHPG